MRKVEGISQREIAARLGVSESIVENEGARGLRLILKALRDCGENGKQESVSFRSNKRRGR
jgi:DNA-directed RNA polymerase specialized sigma24 family protein